MGSRGLIIIGGGYAGLSVAASARAAGYLEPIRIIGEEPLAPYHRPPLSKGFLLNKVPDAELPIRDESFYRDHSIELETGAKVISIDRDGRRLLLANGSNLSFARLVLATGSAARKLPIESAKMDGVLEVRTLGDAVRLRDALKSATEVIVVGGGFIGLEVASTAASMGLNVTVLEASARLLARAAAPPLAVVVEAMHRRAGVDVRPSVTAREFKGINGRIREVLCSDGTVLPADLVVVGIGAQPRTELARAIGLPCGNGIETGTAGATHDPHIFAAGECASAPNSVMGQRLRLESVQHAQDHGKAVGMALAGRSIDYGAVPWFWSEQHGTKLQMAGLPHGYDSVVHRGEVESGRFSIFYFRNTRLIAVDSINAPGDHMLAKRLIAKRTNLSPDVVRDPASDLRAWAETSD